MTTGHTSKLRVQAVLSLAMIMIGLALLALMVVVESEPGALPLLLIVLGTAWYLVTRFRARARD